MTYLDYSATTPVDEEVLNTFVKASKYIGNPNSLHKLGVEAKELIEQLLDNPFLLKHQYEELVQYIRLKYNS